MRARVPVLALAFVLAAGAHQPQERPENSIHIFSISLVLQNGEDLVDTSLAFSSAMTPQEAVESFCWRHACSDAHRHQALSVASEMAAGRRGSRSALPTGPDVACNASYPVLLHQRSGFSELRTLPIADCDREGASAAAIDAFCQTGGCSLRAKQRLNEVLAPPPANLDAASSGAGGGDSAWVPPALQALFPECDPAFWEWYARDASALPGTALQEMQSLAVVVPARNAEATLLEALHSINASAAHLAATQA
ncbi:hypothetical protein T484DRAFT_1767388 [Baffinella frigidus]|nr:hypothetical protein T484DRAFT_1767388 [Cryptophyta sp. CCMP2293]